MTTIDHAAEARKLIEAGHGKTPETAALNQREAQVHATLALVEAQEAAAEQARIANWIAYLSSMTRFPPRTVSGSRRH